MQGACEDLVSVTVEFKDAAQQRWETWRNALQQEVAALGLRTHVRGDLEAGQAYSVVPKADLERLLKAYRSHPDEPRIKHVRVEGVQSQTEPSSNGTEPSSRRYRKRLTSEDFRRRQDAIIEQLRAYWVDGADVKESAYIIENPDKIPGPPVRPDEVSSILNRGLVEVTRISRNDYLTLVAAHSCKRALVNRRSSSQRPVDEVSQRFRNPDVVVLEKRLGVVFESLHQQDMFTQEQVIDVLALETDAAFSYLIQSGYLSNISTNGKPIVLGSSIIDFIDKEGFMMDGDGPFYACIDMLYAEEPDLFDEPL